jgi:hypothetical protein
MAGKPRRTLRLFIQAMAALHGLALDVVSKVMGGVVVSCDKTLMDRLALQAYIKQWMALPNSPDHTAISWLVADVDSKRSVVAFTTEHLEDAATDNGVQHGQTYAMSSQKRLADKMKWVQQETAAILLSQQQQAAAEQAAAEQAAAAAAIAEQAAQMAAAVDAAQQAQQPARRSGRSSRRSS